MQTAPPRTAWGTSSRLASVPTEKKAGSRSPASSASGVASSTASSVPPKRTRLPAERTDANARTAAKPRSARSSSVTVPTAPVAPTTPTRTCPSGMLALRARRGELEHLVQRGDRSLDIGVGDVERDLDRRRGDELRLDAELAQGRERAGGDAGVALHPCSDDAHLAEVVALAPVRPQSVERSAGLVAIGDGSREEDLGTGLDDRVNADRGCCKRVEEGGSVSTLDPG